MTREKLFAPVVDLSRSPHAKLRPVSVNDVEILDGFWKRRIETNQSRTLMAQFDEIENTGRLDNFRALVENRTPDTPNGEPKHLAPDSDIYKLLEAAASSLASHPDAELEARLDAAISLIAGAQAPDGYLCTAFMFGKTDKRWQDLNRGHELYCGGHLMQAAVAHSRATGKKTLLDVATKWADCADAYFGPGKTPGTCGHPEIEMALVELFRETGERRYLELSVYFVEMRGQKPPLGGGTAQNQDNRPVREQTTVDGHAVRQFYLASGVSDIYAETGGDWWPVLMQQWHDARERKQYVNGGTGVTYRGEGFSAPYDLPNRMAYGETCAAISWLMWNWRLLQIAPEARFADAMELSLYNAILSAITPAGDEYFYVNPLEHDGRILKGQERGACCRSRSHWDAVACCPPNVARLLAQFSGYFYSTDSDGIWAHHFAASRADLKLQSGERVSIVQQTNYPWDGAVSMRIETAPESEWSLRVRIPAWAKGAQVKVNGETVEAAPGTYCEMRRVWRAGDEVSLELFEQPRFVRSHPYVLENTGRVAVFRGPLLYCLEACDHPATDLRDLGIATDAALQTREETAAPFDTLGGIVALEGSGTQFQTADALYRDDDEDETKQPAPLRMIPYFAWANREHGAMKVWLRRV